VTTLDQALADWAARHQLTHAQSSAIRARIQAEKTSAPDVEWLWDLLRPVTSLLEGPHRLYDTLSRPYVRPV
jgi:hypothetical protein